MDLGERPDLFGPEAACAMLLENWYAVRIDAGCLEARLHPRFPERRQDALPYEVDFTQVLPQLPPVPGQLAVAAGERWDTMYARRHAAHIVRPVADGWLIGFNGGHYGGSLWWYPKAQGRGIKLSDQNVQAIVVAPGGTQATVLSGLAISSVEGQAFRVARRATESGWHVLSAPEFRGTPAAFVMHEGDMLVATTRSVERLPLSGDPIVLYASKEMVLGAPLTIAVGESNEIVVGMRHFVLVLRPGPDGYLPRWYVPMPCGGIPESAYNLGSPPPTVSPESQPTP
ncbi:MAG TPA: hypothetical protein VMF13_06660 [Luteitalea sp.]|nr:hypothetical protein [Luteitalea sp.]